MMLTTMMHEKMLALAQMAIAHHPLPKRQRMAGQSRKSRRESLDNFTEGEDSPELGGRQENLAAAPSKRRL
jgi:hypothetical protein